MPSRSSRAFQIYELDSIIRTLVINEDDESSEFQEILDIRMAMYNSRYLTARTHVPKTNAMNELLWEYEDAEFRQIVRTTKWAFYNVFQLIKDHPIFQNMSRNPQAPAALQFVVAVQRLGCDGNGISTGRVSRLTGICEGSVVMYTNRVFRAIYEIKNDVICWPNSNERAIISSRYASKGFPGCILTKDGTHINFNEKPHVDGEVWFNRKIRYST
jgi:hypothetical protein